MDKDYSGAKKNATADLRRIAANSLDDPYVIIALLEHQVDMMGEIILELIDDGEVDPVKKEALEEVLEYKSIDFDRINHPLESYKVPNMVKTKRNTRYVQEQYLRRKLEQE